MNTDTVYVLNQTKIPDMMQVVVDNLPDTLVVNGDVTVSNFAEPYNYENQLDSLGALGKDILEYGIGYSDAVKSIAFPLIIAVFAFALPFLFSAINHVNNRYDSSAIANMFESSNKYKTFWYSIAVNVGLMLIYGGLSLLPFNALHHLIGIVFPYLFVCSVTWMVVSVFLFMLYFMTYNKPYSVVDEVNRQYLKEKFNAKNKDLRRSNRFIKKSETKSQSGKKVWEMIGSMYVRSYSNNADFNFINRLSEMCRFAIRNNNYSLYTSVWSKIFEIQKKELEYDDTKCRIIVDDCQKSNTNSFLLKTIDNSCELAVNMEIQGSLIRTWLQCFAHDKYPNDIDFQLLMRSLFKVAGKGNIRFLEKYFSDCKYSFDYVLRLPQVLYVKGGDVSNRINVEQKCSEKWNEICDYHFVLAAFTYYMGLSSLPKQILSEEFGMDLLPRNRQELMLTYARCKAKMSPDGGYDHLNAEELYGKRVDPDYIDSFAVLLFALLEDGDTYIYFPYSNDDISKKLKDYKSVFYKKGEKYKKDAYIKQIYNKVCELNFNKAFEDSYGILHSKPSKETFENTLSESLKNSIRTFLHNQVMQLRSFTGDEMWGDSTEEKVEELTFGICQIRLTKHLVEQWSKAEDIRFNLRDIPDIFKNRAYYLYMQILLSWKCDFKAAQPDSLADIIKDAVGGHPEDYVLIDYDSNVNIWLSMKYKGFRKTKCEGIDYVMSSSIGYLRDTYPYRQLNGKLILIRKRDLPALVRTSEGDVSTTFDDLSSYASNCMDLRVSIDSKYAIKYKKNVCIKSFEVVPMMIK